LASGRRLDARAARSATRPQSWRLAECAHHEKPTSGTVTRRLIEIESLADFDAHISKTQRLNGWFVQSVDLTERSGALLKVDPAAYSNQQPRLTSADPARCCSRGFLSSRLIPTEHVRTTRQSCMALVATP
jgi:hypothetical protein